jgi:hypothetical protein
MDQFFIKFERRSAHSQSLLRQCIIYFS